MNSIQASLCPIFGLAIQRPLRDNLTLIGLYKWRILSISFTALCSVYPCNYAIFSIESSLSFYFSPHATSWIILLQTISIPLVETVSGGFPALLPLTDSWLLNTCLLRLECQCPLIYLTFGIYLFVLRSKWLFEAENNGETLRHRWLSITGRVFSLTFLLFFPLQGGEETRRQMHCPYHISRAELRFYSCCCYDDYHFVNGDVFACQHHRHESPPQTCKVSHSDRRPLASCLLITMTGISSSVELSPF